jgi:choloylglycine hydrolase
MHQKRYNACVFLVAVVLFVQPLLSCTGILLTTRNRSYVHARTLEFGQELACKLLFIPRNHTFAAPAPDGKSQGLSWQGTYAVLGINAFDTEGFIDGVNERGLAGGLFYFPGFAHYQQVTPRQYSRSLPMWQLVTWILTTCSTVAEVKKNLHNIFVIPLEFGPMHEVVPAHAIVHDMQGKSLVIEYVNGKLMAYDNPFGVITNAPTFDWHMTNIRNYLNVSSHAPTDKIMAGQQFSPLGQGAGMCGLPGDFTPPSRFVRAVFFTQAAPVASTELDAVYQAFHILNNFDIPRGSAVNASGNEDYTQWTNAIDMRNKVLYFRKHNNCQLARVDLTKLIATVKKPTTYAMEYADTVVDIV